MNHVLHPGEVSVTSWRHTEFPSRILSQMLTAPITHVERRICEDKVGLQVLVEIISERICIVGPDIGFDASNRQIHLGETPRGRVRFLTINGDVAQLAAMLPDEFLALDKHAAGTTAWVINAAFVRFDHFDEELDDTSWGVELAALFTFRTGELSEEILVDAPEDVFGPALLVTKSNFPEQIDEFAQSVLIERRAGIVLRQNALQRGVLLLDGNHRVVDYLSYRGLLCIVLKTRPSGHFRNPEDILSGVFVAVLGISVRLFLKGFVPLLKSIRDVLEENQTEDDVLVFGSVHVPAQLVGHLPELLLETKVSPIVRLLLVFADLFRHR